ncbi:hypothetical protein FOXG_21596 [Fusarium oxysporum f. sp. lycopersici 4287]|uniref:Uncharacterized protein n=1 Tax=Fusarium oxysporum f. sp. lycopersici (strain 4287 / CBS 123668 / FGSC 9935 / NRRL 34936) TaxID=426428 RepID=A0A0J9VZJ6_FUSO4|nr:hypothetical protein FOXG_21596 [Fusarium oxysporum f. sp. lycopersici 4287]KNB16191.1 hypothetical protein FOXG_21596 [Fusarium oxysporum f. sp. lycopersici 4287]
MSRQGSSYFDIVRATVGESLTDVSINKATDEIDAESGCENDTPVIEKKLIVPARRI